MPPNLILPKPQHLQTIPSLTFQNSTRSSSRNFHDPMGSFFAGISPFVKSLANFRFEPAAVQFAMRMAILLTLSSLFVLVKDANGHRFPDGMWVLVSVLFVCWFPSLDAASVIEKSTQRLIGTAIGAFFGLSCGFCSLWLFPDTTTSQRQSRYQAAFLGVCMLVFNFAFIWLAGQCKAGAKKVIRRYAYATILCVLTFCICMLPFGLEDDPKWERGVWRIANVIIGCFMGAVGSIVVWPKSTIDVLRDKTQRQVRLVGEASHAVLQLAADSLGGKVRVQRLADELLNTPLQTTVRWRVNRSNSNTPTSADSSTSTSRDVDVALRKYEDALADWNASTSLFPLARFDPFQLFPNRDKVVHSEAFRAEIARTLARCMRIQTSVVMLDGMIRSETDFEFSKTELDLFVQSGRWIQEMLATPLTHKNERAALQLFDSMDRLRTKALSLSTAVSNPGVEMQNLRSYEMRKFKDSVQRSLLVETLSGDGDDDLGRGIPKFVSLKSENSLFFLKLVEHLILRSLRLFQAWKQVEHLPRHDQNAGNDISDDMNSVQSLLGF